MPESTSATSISQDSGLSNLEKVPTFYPTEDDFTDPIAYIESIREKAELFGMCRIIPPASWKMESKVNEEIRFTTQMQHLHRLNNRFVRVFYCFSSCGVYAPCIYTRAR